MATLTRAGAPPNEAFSLADRLVTIGSAPGNDLRLESPGVAEHHATVQLDGESFVIRTTSRANTLHIQGKKRREHTLRHGDRVVIGEAELDFSMLAASPHPSGSSPHASRGLEHLRALAASLLGTYDVTQLLADLLDAVLELSDGEKGFVILAEDGGWRVPVARQIEACAIDTAELQLSDSVISHAIASGRPLIIADVRSEEAFRGAQSVVNLELASVLCLPLFAHGELLGLIYVGDDRVTSFFGEVDLEILQVFSALASLIIANALQVNALQD